MFAAIASRRLSLLRLVGMGIATSIAFASSPASAGDRALISTLPVLPTPKDASTAPEKLTGVAGISIKEQKSYGGGSYVDVTAQTSKGYCFVSKEYGLRLQANSSSSPYEDELWRFTEADGKASLERTRLQIVPTEKSAWLKSKTQIDLRQVAQTNGIAVWGFREMTGDVILVARGGDGGRESPRPKKDEVESFQFVSSDCAWGVTRLNVQLLKTGTVAQLHGSLPPVGEGKQKVTPQYVVNGSLMKLSRDPEPVLAVSVRLLEPR